MSGKTDTEKWDGQEEVKQKPLMTDIFVLRLKDGGPKQELVEHVQVPFHNNGDADKVFEKYQENEMVRMETVHLPLPDKAGVKLEDQADFYIASLTLVLKS